MNVRGDFLKFPHSTNTTALICKSRKENPQKLTQLSSRSHPRHLVGKNFKISNIRNDSLQIILTQKLSETIIVTCNFKSLFKYTLKQIT